MTNRARTVEEAKAEADRKEAERKEAEADAKEADAKVEKQEAEEENPAPPTQEVAHIVPYPAGGLAALSVAFFGDDSRVEDIYNLNRDTLRSDSSGYIGQLVRIPTPK